MCAVDVVVVGAGGVAVGVGGVAVGVGPERGDADSS